MVDYLKFNTRNHILLPRPSLHPVVALEEEGLEDFVMCSQVDRR